MAVILVTGGAGYIGGHTCKALAEAGHTPVVYSRFSKVRRPRPQWGPIHVGDIHDTAHLAAVLREHQPAAIIHLAAEISVGQSATDPLLYHQSNTAGTLDVVRCALDAGVDKLVFASTSAVYGAPREVPIREEAALAPVNAYGRSKAAAETILADAASVGMNTAALRYFNAAGADHDGTMGDEAGGDHHIIPLLLRALRSPSRPFHVFGADYPTRDGTCVRDYVHVADIARANVRAVNLLLQDDITGFSPINIGAGHGASVLEIIDAVRRVTGRPLLSEVMGRRPGDPPTLIADMARAKALLGIAPKSSHIDTIIHTAWQFECAGVAAPEAQRHLSHV